MGAFNAQNMPSISQRVVRTDSLAKRVSGRKHLIIHFPPPPPKFFQTRCGLTRTTACSGTVSRFGEAFGYSSKGQVIHNNEARIFLGKL